MRVLVTTFWAYPHAGGVSSHISSLASAFGARDVAIRVLSEHAVGGAIDILEKIQRFKLAIRELAPAVDLFWPQDVYVASALLDSGVAKPFLLTVHGYAAFEVLATGKVPPGCEAVRLVEVLEQRAYEASPLCIAVGTGLASHVRAWGGREVHCVLNGVDTEFFRPGDKTEARMRLGLPLKKKVIVCARRLTRKNGVEFAVDALAKLPGDYLILAAGDGELRSEIERRIKARFVENRFLLLGALPAGLLRTVYQAADAAVVPSVPVAGVEEASSIAALEAMASGLPIVASNIGALPEIIPSGQGGFLVPPADPDALALSLQEALVHKDCYRDSLRRWVEEKFSLAQWGQKMWELMIRASRMAQTMVPSP